MADDFNVISERVGNEGAVVISMVMRPEARGAIVLATVLERSSMECINSGAV